MFRTEDILEKLKTRPFEPFRIHVTDGSTYEIRHPEFVMVSKNKVLLFVPGPSFPHPYFERADTVALLHITRLEPIEPPATQPASQAG